MTPEICTQRKRCWKLRGRRSRNITKCAIGDHRFGSFEVLSDHGDAEEDDGDVDGFLEESTGMMPPPPPASWFKDTETSKHNEMHCRKFRKPCNGDRRDEEFPFFDCWDGKHEQSDVLQQMNTWVRNAPMSVPSEKNCLSVNFPVCSVCVSEVGCVPSPVRHLQ